MKLSPFSFDQTRKRVLILGYGKEGKSTLQFLQKNFPDWEFGIADARETVEADSSIQLHLGKDYLKAVQDYDIVFKAPGIPWNADLQAQEAKITSATQLFFDRLDSSNTVIAVTGSKGKSTTASLLAHVLKAAGKPVNLVGNIGSPALDFVDRKGEFFVVELSSYQLDRLQFKPQIAVWTSFFPEHLDTHGSLEAYKEAKSFLVRNQDAEQIFIYQDKYPELEDLTTRARRIKVHGSSSLKSGLIGEHNRQNVALVVAVAQELGIDEKTLAEAVASFKALAHRLEFVGEFKGLRFYDDAIATNPQATLMALDVFGEEIGTLFLGGSEKKSDYRALVQRIQSLKTPKLVLFPVTGEKIRKLFEESSNFLPQFFQANSMEDAVRIAYTETAPGKVVLLSTACPSFSLWSGFEEKGRLFQEAVRAQAKSS